MTTNSSNTSGTIVVGVDGSPSADLALAWAVEEAAFQKRPLVIVHAERRLTTQEMAIYGNGGTAPSELEQQLRVAAASIVEGAAAKAGELDPAVEASTLFEVGDAREVLLRISETAAMVVVGSRGHGRIVSLLLGSVSAAVAKHAACPVAVVRPGKDAERHGVLVGVNGSRTSAGVVELAYREASARDLPLTVVHGVWDPLVARVRWGELTTTDPFYEDARRQVSESLAGMAEKFPEVETRVALTRGAVDVCLVDLSREHDLLVVGRRSGSRSGRLGLSGLSTSIVEHAEAPVIVVP